MVDTYLRMWMMVRRYDYQIVVVDRIAVVVLDMVNMNYDWIVNDGLMLNNLMSMIIMVVASKQFDDDHPIRLHRYSI